MAEVAKIFANKWEGPKWNQCKPNGPIQKVDLSQIKTIERFFCKNADNYISRHDISLFKKWSVDMVHTGLQNIVDTASQYRFIIDLLAPNSNDGNKRFIVSKTFEKLSTTVDGFNWPRYFQSCHNFNFNQKDSMKLFIQWLETNSNKSNVIPHQNRTQRQLPSIPNQIGNITNGPISRASLSYNDIMGQIKQLLSLLNENEHSQAFAELLNMYMRSVMNNENRQDIHDLWSRLFHNKPNNMGYNHHNEPIQTACNSVMDASSFSMTPVNHPPSPHNTSSQIQLRQPLQNVNMISYPSNNNTSVPMTQAIIPCENNETNMNNGYEYNDTFESLNDTNQHCILSDAISVSTFQTYQRDEYLNCNVSLNGYGRTRGGEYIGSASRNRDNPMSAWNHDDHHQNERYPSNGRRLYELPAMDNNYLDPNMIHLHVNNTNSSHIIPQNAVNDMNVNNNYSQINPFQ